MLDVDLGTFLPDNDAIALYYPERVLDVIEKRVHYDEPVEEYRNEYTSHVNKCAIKYDKPEYLIIGSIGDSEVESMIRYISVRCFSLCFSRSPLGIVMLFWKHFRGYSAEKPLYDIATSIGGPIDGPWVLRTLSSGDNRPQVANVIRWMGVDSVIIHAYILELYVDVVVDVYGIDPFMRDCLMNPSSIMDTFISSALGVLTHNSLYDHIERHLRDDAILYAVVENIQMDRLLLSESYVYYQMDTHPDVASLLRK